MNVHVLETSDLKDLRLELIPDFPCRNQCGPLPDLPVISRVIT